MNSFGIKTRRKIQILRDRTQDHLGAAEVSRETWALAMRPLRIAVRDQVERQVGVPLVPGLRSER